MWLEEGIKNQPWVACCWGLCRDIPARGQLSAWLFLYTFMAQGMDSSSVSALRARTGREAWLTVKSITLSQWHDSGYMSLALEAKQAGPALLRKERRVDID